MRVISGKEGAGKSCVSDTSKILCVLGVAAVRGKVCMREEEGGDSICTVFGWGWGMVVS